MASCAAITNIRANNNNKNNNMNNTVDNSHRLPVEVWHLIFQYLDVLDLCRCCQVCNQWNQLICGNDRTYWQRLYLHNRHHIHPNWPNDSDKDIVSWMKAIKHNYLVQHFWSRLGDENSLLANLFRNRKRGLALPRFNTVTVGRGQDYDQLVVALTSIPSHEFIRIIVYPGRYQGNLVTIKRTAPLEIIGHGDRKDIIIDIPLIQQGFNMRCENVTFKCDDGYNRRIEVTSGHLQMDICLIDCFAITIHFPGSGHIRYCELIGYSYIWLYDADIGLIEHCKFVNTSESIFVAGWDRIDNRKFRSIHFTKHWYEFVVVDNKCPNSWDKKESTSSLHNENDANISNSNSSLSNEYNVIADKAKTISNLVHGLVSTDDLNSIHNSISHGSNCSNNEDPNPRQSSNLEESAPSCNVECTDIECNNMESTSVRSVRTDESCNDSDALYQNFHLMSDQDNDSRYGRDDNISRMDRQMYDMNYLDVDVGDLAEILSHEYLESPTNQPDDNTSITDVLNASSKSLNQLLAKHTKPPQPKSKELVEENLNETKAVIIRNCCFINCEAVISMRSHATVSVVNNMMSSISRGVRCVGESSLYMIDNFITDCHLSGVYIREKSTGLIDRNIFIGVGEAAIDIRSEANPTVQRNVIEDGLRSGIVIMEYGQGKILSNLIVRNRESGIHILINGKTIICNNLITENGAGGITVGDSGNGFIIGNTIKESHWAGIDVCNGAKPYIARNEIIDGASVGIILGDNSGGKIEFNKISGNNGVGISVSLTSSSVIQWNTICDNTFHGALLSSGNHNYHIYDEIDNYNEPDQSLISYNSKLIFNVFCRNKKFGICIDGYKVAFLKGNSIFGNTEGGLIVSNTYDAKIIENDISANGGYGVVISSDGKATLDGNGIYDNQDCCVKIDGHCALKNNDLCCNINSTIIVGATATSYISNNRIFSNGSYGLFLQEGSQSLIEDNKIYYCNNAAVHKHENCIATLQNNCCSLHPPSTSINPSVPWADDTNTGLRPLITTPLQAPKISLPSLRAESSPKGCNCGQPSQVCNIL
ncbi:uncharacterized protein TRIADDRAFT_58945 [Trichoplax adhaerens]|uniref:F-box domain-containing protein n=1 Tax=Trichoplax adhaerens TaxID=10228 RepID=B3S441_TRIAD|nr:hypothetical protein TRIADDRAFT_58945 [Trichoplax adhaerens]EDV22395.1 hypothetical protein TRIADDRAFT_58945 [Trichoplax adhaerens]|eukprot:XP_002114939.1 hypothetical protein TRIADDRAFT_58945 [Trichoplax adhaerens]